nr:MAG TPA: hypothetical protein [Caudoviricetes sp.]
MAAYSQAGSIPSGPVSCRCGQLRTDRESPAVRIIRAAFLIPPGLQNTPGSFYTLPLLQIPRP